jgi:hypothetical protein
VKQENLNGASLKTAHGILSLGMVIAKELLSQGEVTVFLNSNDEVEVCPMLEVGLDSLDQDKALEVLIDKGYSDEQMISYLKGRISRAKYL